MAIAPNTTFVSGAILTAAQMNALPFGVVAFASVGASDTSITAEETQITCSAFTAIANRYYKVTYFEPRMYGATSAAGMTMRIKNGATVLTRADVYCVTTTEQTGTASYVSTFTAGSKTLTATLQYQTGTGIAARDANSIAYILVEDIGPA